MVCNSENYYLAYSNTQHCLMFCNINACNLEQSNYRLQIIRNLNGSVVQIFNVPVRFMYSHEPNIIRLANVRFSSHDLTSVRFSSHDLTNVRFSSHDLTNVRFSSHALTVYLIRNDFDGVPGTMPPQFFEVPIEGVLRQLADERGWRYRLVLREVLAPASSEKVFLFAWKLGFNDPKLTRQVYNLFQDLWNRFIILEGG